MKRVALILMLIITLTGCSKEAKKAIADAANKAATASGSPIAMLIAGLIGTAIVGGAGVATVIHIKDNKKPKGKK